MFSFTRDLISDATGVVVPRSSDQRPLIISLAGFKIPELPKWM